LRGAGRGSSFAKPQLATHAFTSPSGTAARVCLKASSRRRSSDIRPGNIDDRIQQCHGFGKHGRNVLAALVGRLTQTRISVGVYIQCATDDVHGTKMIAEGRFVDINE
jgi:hypothetical protein